jgi:hypothetical protein
MNFGDMSEHKPVAFYGRLDTVKFVGDNENMNFSSTAIREVCYGLQNNIGSLLNANMVAPLLPKIQNSLFVHDWS